MRNITKEEVAFLMQHHDDYTRFRRGYVVNFSDEVLDTVEKISNEVYNIPMNRSCGSCVADAMRNVFNLAREESEKHARRARSKRKKR
jgi:hypothetical protein